MDVDELEYGIKHTSLTPDSISAIPNSGKPQRSSTSGKTLPQTIMHSAPSQETPTSSRDATQDMTFNEYLQWHQGTTPSRTQVSQYCKASSTIPAISEAVCEQQPENSQSSTEIDSITSEHPASLDPCSSKSHPINISSPLPNSISTTTEYDNSILSSTSKPSISYTSDITICF